MTEPGGLERCRKGMQTARITLLACALAALGAVAAPSAGARDPWAALRRPLRIKPLAAGARCPVTPAHHLSSGVPDVEGTGPVYPAGFAFSHDDLHPTWMASKTLWAWEPALKTRATRVLVRGRRIDRPGVVRFQLGPNWSPSVSSELRIDTAQPVGSFGNSTWGTTVTLVLVRAPGCYALQLDSPGGTRTIVLAARRG